MNWKATFVAASQSDLLWLDQLDLISAMEEYADIRPCLEKTASSGRDVSHPRRFTLIFCFLRMFSAVDEVYAAASEMMLLYLHEDVGSMKSPHVPNTKVL